jgi:hypothetical protein
MKRRKYRLKEIMKMKMKKNEQSNNMISISTLMYNQI